MVSLTGRLMFRSSLGTRSIGVLVLEGIEISVIVGICILLQNLEVKSPPYKLRKLVLLNWLLIRPGGDGVPARVEEAGLLLRSLKFPSSREAGENSIWSARDLAGILSAVLGLGKKSPSRYMNQTCSKKVSRALNLDCSSLFDRIVASISVDINAAKRR